MLLPRLPRPPLPSKPPRPRGYRVADVTTPRALKQAPSRGLSDPTTASAQVRCRAIFPTEPPGRDGPPLPALSALATWLPHWLHPARCSASPLWMHYLACIGLRFAVRALHRD